MNNETIDFSQWVSKFNDNISRDDFKINKFSNYQKFEILLDIVLTDYLPRVFQEISTSDFYQHFSHFFKPIPVSGLRNPATASGLKKWLSSNYGDLLLYSLLCKSDGEYMFNEEDVIDEILTPDNIRRIPAFRYFAYVLAYVYIFLNENEQKRFHDLFYMIPPNRIWQYNVESWITIILSIARMKADFDNVIVVTGYEGSGKSTFVKSLMYVYRYLVFGEKPQNENIILNVEDYAESLMAFKNVHGEVFHLDEAGTMLFSRDAGTNFSKLQIKILEVARERNWMFFVVIPNINWLDKYVRTHRIAGWLDITNRGFADYYGRKLLMNSPEFLKSNINVQTNGFTWGKIKRRALHLSVPNFDFDDEVLSTYNEKKKVHVDKTIDEFVNYVALMTQNSDLLTHSGGGGATGYPESFFMLNHFPKLVCVNDATGISAVSSSGYNKNVLKELVKNGELYSASNDSIFSMTYFQSDDKSNPVTRIFGIGLDVWKQYVHNIKRSTKTNFAGDFGFNIFRRYLFGVIYSYSLNRLSTTMSSPYLYEKYALYLLKSFMNLNSLFDAYLFAHVNLSEKAVMSIQNQIQESSLSALHDLFYSDFLPNLSDAQVFDALKGLFSLALLEFVYQREKSFSDILKEYFGNMKTFSQYTSSDIKVGQLIDRIQTLSQKYVELLKTPDSARVKAREFLVELLGATDSLQVMDVLDDKLFDESLKRKINEVNGSLDEQESKITEVTKDYEDYVSAILDKLHQIRESRKQIKSKPKADVEVISNKSKAEELLDELKEVFG